ncbi:acyl-CoA dehydrogenase family protein [Streptomyces yaizuensis]|uniref:Acyl-CoA/acyl-ACP dehydrogenase n=1 Tax=Streptomyces yaizuensis TaxID=2989713 RepID=A0ABQ5NXT8_9ACTN|nr:acyl-CoA dehydrogenase family protein [Streptomyces sp. YSPA8]GLF95173.1 acyl-CoA/acyl-ACP dehydrogenase [Streptomyces sp. YSPA8]
MEPRRRPPVLAEEELRRRVRAFAEAEIAPRIPYLETAGVPDRALLDAIARHGWTSITIPARYGGMDAGHRTKTVVIEELSRISGAAGAAAQAAELGTAMILNLGSPSMREEWLPRIAQGVCLPTIAVTEPGSGSHVLGMETTARRKGRGWVLTGRKDYVGNAHTSDLHCVVARTGKPGRPDSLTAFLVETGRPGLMTTPHPRSLGLRGFSFGELVLDRVRIPEEHVIGTVGGGLAAAYSSSVLHGRANLAAVAVGLHQATLDQAVRHTTTTTRYGRPLAAPPVIRQGIGQITAALRVSRHTLHAATALLDAGQPCDSDLISAKYQAVNAAIAATLTGLRLHGAAGLRCDLPMERYHRDALCLEPPAGTSDIQLLRLAEDALGEARTPGPSASATPAAERHRP